MSGSLQNFPVKNKGTKSAHHLSVSQDHQALKNDISTLIKSENHAISELKLGITALPRNAEILEKRLDLILQELDKYRSEVEKFISRKNELEAKTHQLKRGLKKQQPLHSAKPRGDTASKTKGTTSVPLPSTTAVGTTANTSLATATSPINQQGTSNYAQSSVASSVSMPQKLIDLEGLSELRSCYDDIIKNMPDNYYETVQLLERELCDTHISSIFECSHFTAANQIILECLVERVNCKEDILDLCERLSVLKNRSHLIKTVESLRIAVMQHLQELQQKNKQVLDGHNLNDYDINSTQSSDKSSTKVTHQPSLSPKNADKADGEASSSHSAATSSNIQSQAMGLFNQMGMGQLLSTLTGGAMGLGDSGGDNQGGAIPSNAMSQTDVNEILSQIDIGKMISTVFDGAAGSQTNDPQTMEAMISKVAKDIPGISEADPSDMQAAVSLVMQQKGIEPLLSAAVGAVQKATVTSDDHKESTQYKELEVLQKNYAALCNTMTDIDDLLKYFVVEKIISTVELEEITCLTVKSDKVRKLLIHIVGPLKAGHEIGFYAMLRIMKSYGHNATQSLSDNITKELQAQADSEQQHTASKQQEDKKEELELNFRSPHAPPLPQNLIVRQQLLSHMVDALTSDEAGDNVDVNLLITGMGGYGKSTLTKALCHHSSIKKRFPGGFLWIQLGPMPKVRPIAMLLSIHNDLTGKQWDPIAPHVQVQLTEEEIMATLPKALQNICKNKKLLIIVDDVWETKDLHAYIKTFSCCKIVVTSRRNDLTNTFSCGSEVSIKGMTTFEAVELLAIKEFRALKPSTNDKLHTLAINLHCWPLLLNLVRNQFQAHCKKLSSVSPDQVIDKVTKKLYDYGLTAFDPKEEKCNKELAAIASIKASLDFLKSKDLNRLVRLVTSFTFATIFPKSLLYNLWEISLENVESCCDELWSMGLLSYTKLPYATNKDDTVAVEVHSVIVQYVFDNELGHAFSNVDDFLHAMMFDISTLYKYAFGLPKSKDSYIETLSNVGFMDSIITPMQIKAVPMIVHVLTDLLLKDLKNEIPFPTLKKITYMQIREQQKDVISLLDKGKIDEALALIDEESFVYVQYLQRLCTECEAVPVEIKQKISHVLPVFKMTLKLNFIVRVQSLDWLNSENRTDEQNYNIHRNANDKGNELLMPALQEIQDLYQTMSSYIPGFITDTNSVPFFMDTLSKILSSDHTVSVSELVQETMMKFSKQQNACSTQ